jgi:eukaryotic-like serine/threonine-protein kinase
MIGFLSVGPIAGLIGQLRGWSNGGFNGGMIGLLGGGLISLLSNWLNDRLSVGLSLGLAAALVSGLSSGFDSVSVKIDTEFPNQFMKRFSVKNFWAAFLLSWLSFGLSFGLIGGFRGWVNDWELSLRPIGSTGFGLILVLFTLLGLFLLKAINVGGPTELEYYAFRLILWWNGYTPLNFFKFLDHCAKLTLLKKVDGGCYIFIHQRLLDYFADLHTRAAPNKSLRNRE